MENEAWKEFQYDPSAAPPETEPERQYYFIHKCRQYVQKFKEEHGFAPSYITVTFGCQMK